MDQFPEEASEGLQEPETQPQEVVVEPDSGLGRVSEAQTEEETEEDDYTGFYTVVENGAMTPDKVASPQEAVAEDSSDDEFGQKDMIGTGVIGAMPVVTAGPNMAEDADSDEDVYLSDTEVVLLRGDVVSDGDGGDGGETGHEDADTQGHDTAGDGDDAGNTQALRTRLATPKQKTKRQREEGTL